MLDADQASSKGLLDLDNIDKQVKNGAKTMVGKGLNPGKAREHYAAATAKYREAVGASGDARQETFLEAAKRFDDAAERWPDSALEQDAMYMAAESYYFANYFTKSEERFAELLKRYPHCKYMDMAEARRFSIAHYWLGLNDKKPRSFWQLNLTDEERPVRDTFGHAVRVLDSIRIDDPTGKLADDATLAAGNAYFASNKYEDADHFYADLRKTFPSSEHQFRAHFLGLKAKLESYQGSDYSADALNEAEKLIKQIHKQFPNEADQERQYLSRAYAKVRYQKAEREWKMARYYDRRGEYRAARFHYDILVNQYTQTPFADRARERIAAVADEPDVPPQRLSWLVNIFPDDEDVRPLIATDDTGVTRR
jgi:outer membrane protein assembly factor BamD (BamD/ComL family)